MEIKAQIVADSKNEFGNRITTFVLTYPRIIHSELMTHRMFSRNAASSRAVPASKLIHAVETDPFIPLAFQKNHSGMQGTEYITDPKEIEFEIQDWLDDRDYAVKKAKARLERGVTKQLVNRPLEPFQYYTTILTATEFENFFALRCPQYEVRRITKMDIESFSVGGSVSGKVSNDDIEIRHYRSKKDLLKENTFGGPMNDLQWLQINVGQAEIHMMALAEAMWDAYNESTPKHLNEGEWHIPFGDSITNKDLVENLYHYGGSNDILRVKIATARCAQVSYTVVGEDGKESSYENLIKLHDRLAKAGHWSPFEHCAKTMNLDEAFEGPSGNFWGFIQYRKTFVNENITK